MELWDPMRPSANAAVARTESGRLRIGEHSEECLIARRIVEAANREDGTRCNNRISIVDVSSRVDGSVLRSRSSEPIGAKCARAGCARCGRRKWGGRSAECNDGRNK